MIYIYFVSSFSSEIWNWYRVFFSLLRSSFSFRNQSNDVAVLEVFVWEKLLLLHSVYNSFRQNHFSVLYVSQIGNLLQKMIKTVPVYPLFLSVIPFSNSIDNTEILPEFPHRLISHPIYIIFFNDRTSCVYIFLYSRAKTNNVVLNYAIYYVNDQSEKSLFLVMCLNWNLESGGQSFPRTCSNLTSTR